MYLAFLPMLNSKRVQLLDHPRLIAQLCRLERRTACGGRDSVDHPPTQHDDVVNAVAGCAVTLLGQPEFDISGGGATLEDAEVPTRTAEGQEVDEAVLSDLRSGAWFQSLPLRVFRSRPPSRRPEF
jgi:hypothetical protein